MATLTGNTIADTYLGLLSVTGAVGADTVEAVTDGAGTSTSLSISQQRAKIVLGTGSNDDFTINDGSNDILKVEGDTKDVTLLNDLKLLSDASVITFGADSEVSLTHVHNEGLLLNSTNKIQFNDSSQFIQGSSATVLSIGATAEIDLTATAIDINGAVDISGALTIGGDIDFNSGIINLATNSVDVSLVSTADALNFDSNTLSIDASSNRIGIGTNAPDSTIHIVDGTTSSTQAICHVECTEASADAGDVLLWLDWSNDTAVSATARWIDLHDEDGTIGRLESSGTQVDTTFTQESDIRYKENIVDTVLKGLETLNKVKVRDFEWNEKYGASKAGKKVTAGFVADELYEVYPAATKGTPGAVHEDGSIKSMGVMEGAFTRLLIKAVQELSTSNDALKARIEVLEAA